MEQGFQDTKALMPTYKISIDPEALQDIQDVTDWYNEQLKGLGGHFQKQVKSQISSLKKNASAYAVRYDDIRCMRIKRFPFLVHLFQFFFRGGRQRGGHRSPKSPCKSGKNCKPLSAPCSPAEQNRQRPFSQTKKVKSQATSRI